MEQVYDLTLEQSKAIDVIESGENVFITGDAGTGKSTFINSLNKHFKDLNIVYLAPTAVAAKNIGGQTIHSFFKFPPKYITSADIKNYKDDHRDLINAVDIFVIDEISMVPPDIIDGIDLALRTNIGNNLPFGGKQIVMVGDLFQLPPVAKDKQYKYDYNSIYFFDANVWDIKPFKTIYFKEIFRQRDPEFKQLLNKIKNGTITEKELDLINETCYKRRYDIMSDDESVVIATKNVEVDHINNMKLSKLPGEEFMSEAEINGYINPKNFLAKQTLRFKIGAKIMTLSNNREDGYLNGDMFYVDSVSHRDGVVITDDGTSIKKWDYENVKYVLVNGKVEKEVLGVMRQFPFVLGYAFTIHKAQGKTFDKLIISLRGGMFAHGQAYVAMSRATTLQGITLLSPLLKEDIIVDKKILRFYENI